MGIQDLEINCSEIPELISVEDIVAINAMITDSEIVGSSKWKSAEKLANKDVKGKGLETNRPEGQIIRIGYRRDQ